MDFPVETGAHKSEDLPVWIFPSLQIPPRGNSPILMPFFFFFPVLPGYVEILLAALVVYFASFQLVFSENCSTCRFFDMFVGEMSSSSPPS